MFVAFLLEKGEIFMKQLLIAGLMGLFAFNFTAQTASAKGIPLPVIYSSGDDVDLVHEFSTSEKDAIGIPDDVHLGWMHYQFELLWVPFYAGSKGDYVLYQETSDGYAVEVLNTADAAMIGGLIGKDLSGSYSGGMVGNFWGWGLVLGVFVIALIMRR